MLSWSNKARITALLLTLCVSPLAWSCGQYYPQTNALQNLDGLANEMFGQFHAALLREDHASVELPQYEVESRWQGSGALSTYEAEQQQLSAEDFARVQAMRAGTNIEASLQAGVGLSEEVRHYTAGAWAFRHGDMEQAQLSFALVLQLPAAQQTRRGSWAQYMLARIALEELRQATASEARDPLVEKELSQRAAAMFEQVRAMIEQQQGDDPLLLARSSWGEEAAAYLLTGDDLTATRRYLTQAKLGSWSGRSSLLMVARAIVRDEKRLRAALREPLLQALVTALVISSPLDDIAMDPYSPPDQYPVSFILTAYVDALQDLPGQRIAGADQLAALAYRQGHYALAMELLDHTDSPLSWWLRGKLAERAGETDQAKQAYQRAEQMWIADPQTIEQMNAQCGPQVDQARLAAHAGDTVTAMTVLRATGRFEYAMTGLGVMRLSTRQLREYIEQLGATSTDYESNLRHALGLRLLASGDAQAATFLHNGPARIVARHLQDAERTRGHDHRQTAQSLFAAALKLRELDGGELEAALGPNPIEKDTLGFERLRGPLTGNLSANRVAADLANQAADQLAPGSQAFASVLCHATSWLLARNPKTARLFHQRYQLQGKYFAWADNFGRDCPEPQFSDMEAPSTSTALRFKPCTPARSCFRYRASRGVIDDQQKLLWAQRDTEGELADRDTAALACAARGSGWRLPTSTELSGLRVPPSDESMRCGESTRCALPLWFQLSSAHQWSQQGPFDVAGWQVLSEADEAKPIPALCVR